MTTRREFVQTGLALTAVPLASLVFARTHVEAGFTLDRFVFDRRFVSAQAAAAAAAQHGVPVAAFAGDLTELWYHELDLAWRHAPETLGGVTSEQALFVLETLAHDRQMRVVRREPGGLVAGERLVKWVIAPRGSAPSLA